MNGKLKKLFITKLNDNYSMFKLNNDNYNSLLYSQIMKKFLTNNINNTSYEKEIKKLSHSLHVE